MIIILITFINCIIKIYSGLLTRNIFVFINTFLLLFFLNPFLNNLPVFYRKPLHFKKLNSFFVNGIYIKIITSGKIIENRYFTYEISSTFQVKFSITYYYILLTDNFIVFELVIYITVIKYNYIDIVSFIFLYIFILFKSL